MTKPKTLGRKEMVRDLATRMDCNQEDAAKALDAVLESITHLATQAPLTLREFGRFQVRHMPSREVRVPGSDTKIMTRPIDVLKFRASVPRK